MFYFTHLQNFFPELIRLQLTIDTSSVRFQKQSANMFRDDFPANLPHGGNTLVESFATSVAHCAPVRREEVQVGM